LAENLSGQNGKSINRVNPEGISNCVWVDAGLVSYKLCDRDFECENCQFDQIMRQESRRGKKTPLESKSPTGAEESFNASLTCKDTLPTMVREFLSKSIPRTLSPDRLYSKNHLWIKETEDGKYRVGLDNYVTTLFPGTWNVILPQTGTMSRRSGPLTWIILEDGTVVVRSPLDGKVSRSNFQLRESPALLNSDPYESGWICEVSGVEHKKVELFFLNESAAKAFFDNQFLELEKTLVYDLEHKSDHVGVTMMDGGTKLKNLNDVLGSKKYISVLKKLLSSEM